MSQIDLNSSSIWRVEEHDYAQQHALMETECSGGKRSLDDMSQPDPRAHPRKIPKELPKHKLKTDAPTRWNSGFDMVERFLEQQPAVCAALLSQVRKGAHDICTLSEADEHLVRVLKPMKLATTTVSEENMPTLSVIAPLHAQLLANFTAAPEDDQMTHEVKHAIREDLMKRYTSAKERHMLHASSALDPRFKALPFLSEDEKVETYNRLTAEATSLEVVRQEAQVLEEEGDDMPDENEQDDVFEELELEEAGPSTSRPSSSLTALLGQTFSVVNTEEPKSVQTRVEEEVRRYLEAPSLPLSDNPLK